MTPYDFYRGKRVFLTGHTGFKGSWLAIWLAEMGAQVHGVALNPPTAINLFDDAKVSNRLASHHVFDVRDHVRLTKVVQETRPEVVFHLAAQPLVRKSYREPRETYEVNVMGTINLLEAVRATPGVRVCQIITSDKCYENQEWVYGYRENEPMGGADPYSNSKGCAELVVSAYRRSFFSPQQHIKHGVSLASARAGNVIGGGDWAEDRIIPDCIRALENCESILVRNPKAIRPWQHVLEPLSGYLQLAMRQWDDPTGVAEGWNFGPTTLGHMTVREVVETVIAAWGSGKWHSPADVPSVHEANFLKLDITKAAQMLQWQPLLEVPEAIRQTVLWYKARREGGKNFSAAETCREQIRAYASRRGWLS